MYDLSLDANVFTYTVMDEAMQELDILFNTENTELIGMPQYGTNFEQFLWQLTPSEEAVENYIYEKLQMTLYCWLMEVSVSVRCIEGEENNIYYVSITLTEPTDGGETRNKVYQFS